MTEGPKSEAVQPIASVSRGMLSAAFSTGPGLSTLFDQKPDDRQRGDAIDPPGADRPLGGKADDDHKLKPAAGHGLHRIRSQGPAAELLGDGDLSMGENAHGRNRDQSDD
jgi:hypothetical protein